MTGIEVSREQVLAYRLVAQQLDRDTGSVEDTAILDVAEVRLGGETRSVLKDDVETLEAARSGGGAGGTRTLRLLGPYDLYLRVKDRELLVSDPVRSKALWPTLGRGRPGATWPRSRRKRCGWPDFAV